jgi:hypothetical protein
MMAGGSKNFDVSYVEVHHHALGSKLRELGANFLLDLQRERTVRLL